MKDPFEGFISKYLTAHAQYDSKLDSKYGPKKDTVDPARTASAIKWNETRGVKDPYAYYRDSGSSALGRALGAYQVTEGELKTYGPILMGQKIDPNQFLKTPSMQDAYAQAKVKYLNQQKGLALPQILAAHRGGFSNLSNINGTISKYQGYVDSGVNAYNTQPWNPPASTSPITSNMK